MNSTADKRIEGKPVIQIPTETNAAARSRAVVVKRIRFVRETPPPSASVVHEFTNPRRCVAVQEVVDAADIAAPRAWPEPTDELLVELAPAPIEARKLAEGLMQRPDNREAVATMAFAQNGRSIQWRPGRAIVQGPAEGLGEVVAALVDFAFYEGELRTLERAIDSREAGAYADAARAHRIRFSDRRHWQRIGETIEQLQTMRLEYASLQSALANAPRRFERDARTVMTRLLEQAEVETRIEAAGNRLEAFEDLYEGANDRVADFRWYLSGEWLEVGIIFLLLVEIALMGYEIYRHLK